MHPLESVTVELFDYWLRNSFFWEFGRPVFPLTLNGGLGEDGEILGDGGHIGIGDGKNGELIAYRVLVTLRKYHARYQVQAKRGKVYQDIGEILIEQLQVDRLRVHSYEAKGSGFLAKFSGWLERVYEGNQPASQAQIVGRPPMNVNDWAFQEIQKGRDEKEIRREYIQRRANDDLADPAKSFREAMKSRGYKKDKK